MAAGRSNCLVSSLNHVLRPSPLGNHGNSSQPTGAGYPEELQLRCYQTTQWVRTPDHWILNTEAQNPWPYVLQFLPPRLLPLRQLLRGINSDLKKDVSTTSPPTFFLTMSQLQTPENVPPLKHEREVAAPSYPDDETSNSVTLDQAIVSVPAVDKVPEPMVTRRELWSYYCMSLHDSLCSYGRIERLSSVLQRR